MKQTLALLFISVVLSGNLQATEEQVVTLTRATGSDLNPLKGLVPYAGNYQKDGFPHTMEFSYVALSSLSVAQNQFDWTPLERILQEIAGRGHQAILRVYLEYPGKKNGIPKYLVDAGLKVYHWKNGAESWTPDYSDEHLKRCLRQFIATFGAKYDGDPRIGFITAGLLGSWGEWHTHPREDLWASVETQRLVLNAYERAFEVTPILLRYPAGKQHREQAANAGRRFGYHDDSFAWGTLETSKSSDAWFFLAALKDAGPDAIKKWKMQPIGGEIRPEAWGQVFDKSPQDKRIQDFDECVLQTHVSWLLDSGLFQKETWTKQRVRNALPKVRKMGYEYHVPQLKWRRSTRMVTAEVQVQNLGVAPFYYDWPVEFALLSGSDVVVSQLSPESVKGILPGESSRVLRCELDTSKLAAGNYHVAMRVANPLHNGYPLRFANATQDQHAVGWVTLTSLELP